METVLGGGGYKVRPWARMALLILFAGALTFGVATAKVYAYDTPTASEDLLFGVSFALLGGGLAMVGIAVARHPSTAITLLGVGLAVVGFFFAFGGLSNLVNLARYSLGP